MWWRILGALCLAALGVYEWSLAGRQRTPPIAAWQRARAAVAAEIRPEDLVLFSPSWIDPVGRSVFGDRMPLRGLSRIDLATFPTIWHISIRGATHPELVGRTASTTAAFDGVVVQTYVQKPVQPLMRVADLVNDMRQMRGPRPKLVLTEVDFLPRQCVEVVPTPDEPVRLVTRVVLGESLLGGVGLADVFTRRDLREPAEFAIEIDGHEVTRMTVGVEDGWEPIHVATAPGVHEVAYVVQSRERERHVCFLLEAR